MAKEKPITKETAAEVAPAKPTLSQRWRKIKPTRRNVDRGQRALLRHVRKFLFQRWDNLRLARRDVIGWLVLVAILVVVGCLQTVLYVRGQETIAAVDGGTYAEGVVDKIVTVNPLYAVTDGERAAASLIYGGLLRLDKTGHLRPELATSYSVSDDGKTYQVKLRENIRWSDGQNFTADDVVLTVELMQNPTVESALLSSWSHVAVKKVNDHEVTFTLKNALASFPFLLDFGVLPAHVLKGVKPADIKSTFASKPAKLVGTGAFTFRSEETLDSGQTIFRLTANEHYFRGQPRVKTLTIQTYATSEDLLNGFQANEVNAAADLDTRQAAESLDLANTNLIQTPSGDGVFAMLNNSGPITSDKAVREALRLGANRSSVRAAVTADSDEAQLEPVAALDTPITPGLLADVDKLKQPDYNLQAASDKLDAAGWKLGDDGQRSKDGQALELNLVTVKGADYEPAAKNLAEQWGKLGIKIELTAADPSSVQQNYLIPRSYDVLVYQLHLGADPDVFAYWASSQATARGLNFANYRSTLADLILTSARTQPSSNKRASRYADFVKQWLSDVPAIALYRPMYYYLMDAGVQGPNGHLPLIDSGARFSDVRDFTVNLGVLQVTP